MSLFAIQDPLFTPAMRLVSDVTRERVPTVTTTFAHGYVDGLIVRFYVPDAVGMPQLHHLTSPITVTSDTTFTIDIDTSQFDPFVVPANPTRHQDKYAQVVPIGQTTETLNAATRNTLEPNT